MSRKEAARRRLEILDEDFASQVHGLIARHYKRADVRQGISRHVTTERNLLLRVVDEIAAPLYETPPIRTIRDAPEDVSDKLARLVELLELDTFMQAAVGPAFACNVVHIVVAMRQDSAGELVPVLELVTPDISDVEQVGGRLVRLTYDLDTPKDDPRRRVAVDAHGWHYLDAEGEVVEEVAVELGRCPAVPFRLSAHHRGDYWGGKRGHKLVEATLQIARIAAHMGWVRENLNTKLLALICEEEALAAQGKIDPRRPMHVNSESTEAKALVLDLEVRVAGFVEEMREHAEPVLEAYGLPYTNDLASTGDPNVFVPGGVQLHGRRKKIRNRQLPPARRAERDLMHVIALVLEAYGHELAIDPALILERYESAWSELTFADHPLKLLEIQERKMKHGFMGPVDAMLEWHPGLTREQAAAKQQRNDEERAQRLQLVAKHNMPADPADDSNYVAELQGRVGQLERDKRKEEDDHADPT